MKRVFLFTMIVLLYMFLFNHCRNCKSTQLGKMELSYDDKDCFPYSMVNDKIIFTDSVGDTIEWCSSPDYSIWYNMCEDNENMECPGDYYHAEKNIWSMRQDTNNFYFSLYFDDPFFNEPYKKILELNITMTFENQNYYFGGHYTYSAKHLYTAPGNIAPVSKVIAYHDTISVAGKTYYSVYELSGGDLTNGNNENISAVYYDYNDGIAGFRFSDGHTWSLAKID